MRPDRLWLLGGALCALAIVAFGYFFLIGPKYADAGTTRSDTADTLARIGDLRAELRRLQQQKEQIGTLQATLERDRAALPAADSASAFLKELQDAGVAAGVTVSGVTLGSAVDLKALAGFEVYALPVSLTVAGPTDKMNPFLEQLQQWQPRAVLISSVNFAPSSAANADRSAVTVNLQAFYAPAS
ncbi:type 4a pilus biogenesis protein PilO [Dactylosporangium sp. CA-092794]|uniref:type 4a pilus biogenesis protein PilO n=1 Tax=Dactylosporangium sp. CA-092794 TaxID=3239929 RepID=UPI003D8C1C00